MTMKLVTLEDDFNKCNKCRGKSRGDGNSHNNINIVIDTNSQGGASASRIPSTIDGRRAEPQRVPQSANDNTSTENKELTMKLETLIKVMEQNRNNAPQEVIREVKYVPTFIDRIKQIFVPYPHNRIVERVRTKVDPIESNRVVERVRTKVDPIESNRVIERVVTKVDPIESNRTVERVRTKVEPVPNNRIIDRIKKRFVIIRENQPTPPKSLT